MDFQNFLIKETKFDEKIDFPKEKYQNTDIRGLKNLQMQGSIKKDNNQEYVLQLTLTGEMILPDARTLENVTMPLHIQIEEKLTSSNEEIEQYLGKNQNTLDIMGILWENIVLEVPIAISNSKEETMKGIGWEFVSEKKESIDPRLAPLRKLLDEEKE